MLNPITMVIRNILEVPRFISINTTHLARDIVQFGKQATSFQKNLLNPPTRNLKMGAAAYSEIFIPT
jgi:hypothetical protein